MSCGRGCAGAGRCILNDTSVSRDIDTLLWHVDAASPRPAHGAHGQGASAKEQILQYLIKLWRLATYLSCSLLGTHGQDAGRGGRLRRTLKAPSVMAPAFSAHQRMSPVYQDVRPSSESPQGDEGICTASAARGYASAKRYP